MFIFFAEISMDLIVQAQQGNKPSFEALVKKSVPCLVGFFKYLGVPFQHMDDLVQETYMRVFKSLKGFDTSKSFAPWLVTIGRHVYDDLRKSQSKLPLEPDAIPEPVFGTEEQVENRQIVRDLLKNLSDEALLLIELRIFQDLPFSEIARITGETEGALRVRFHRILGNLRSLAEKGGKTYET
jgi:RNA polymerase sigma-70 factor (ECF subfamily)